MNNKRIHYRAKQHNIEQSKTQLYMHQSSLEHASMTSPDDNKSDI